MRMSSTSTVWALITSIALIGVSCSGSDEVAISDTAGGTAPAVTDPPATDPPATDPPATDPPATDPPATDPPVDEAESPCAIKGPENSFDRVACDEPHDAELAAVFSYDDADLARDGSDAGLAMIGRCAPAVQALSGRPNTRPGIDTSYTVSEGTDGAGNSLECYASISAAGGFTASLDDTDVETALGELVFLADLDPGTCFTFSGESFDLGHVVECTAPGALIAIGTFEAEDREYPGVDAVRVERDEKCALILEESGFAVDPATVSGSLPFDSSWIVMGQRVITCDGTPL